MPCSPFQPEQQRPMTAESDGISLPRKSRNQLAKEIVDLRMKIEQSDLSLREVQDRLHLQRAQNNQIVLDMRRRLQRQEEVIRSLKAERDRLMRDLTSRLLLVEAELRKEQKHIETMLEEKDHIIEQQGRELKILKDSRHINFKSVNAEPSKKQLSKARNAALSRRFSIALDEYIRDCTTVSRASPIYLSDGEVKSLHQVNPFCLTSHFPSEKYPSHHNTKKEITHGTNDVTTLRSCVPTETCVSNHSKGHARASSSVGYFPLKKHEAMSLPDLRRRNSTSDETDFCSVEVPERINMPTRVPSYPNLLLQGSNSIIKIPWYKSSNDQISEAHVPLVSTIEASCLDSESLGSSDQSDSLDSGISASDSTDQNFSHTYSKSFGTSFQTHGPSSSELNSFQPSYSEGNATLTRNAAPRRAPPEYATLPQARIYEQSTRSSSTESVYRGPTVESGDCKSKTMDHSGSCEKIISSNAGVSSWVSGSSNRSFGTNHRSVTKPRDIKFRKLTKFQNRLLSDASNSIGMRGLINEVVLTV